jgi:hypothetical protein
MITNNSSVPGQTVGNAIDYLNQLDTGTKPRPKVDEEFIELMVEAEYERDIYKKALEEIATQDPTEMHLIAKYDWVIDIAREALNNG